MTGRYIFAPAPTPSIAIADSDLRFPVRRVFCVGRNYAAHAREMGGDPAREAPFFFGKPSDAVVDDGASVPYPPQTSQLHHEVELVVALHAPALAVDASRALSCVFGYAVGIDLTRRDLQQVAKENGRPWEAAKAFDASAPVGPLALASTADHPASGAIWLDVNGERRQEGDLNQLIWSVAEVIAQLSRLFALKRGDLIFTGTPSGVGPVAPGDELHAGIEGVGRLNVRIAPPTLVA